MTTLVERFAAVAIDLPARLLAPLADVLALGTRCWVGWQFWISGRLKLESWETTLYLFRDEYRTPLLSPESAAVTGTVGELFFPLLRFAGFCGRLGAAGLFAVNAMAVISYSHVLLAEGFEAALAQHVLWGFMLVMLVVYGPGRLSIDHLGLRTRRIVQHV